MGAKYVANREGVTPAAGDVVLAHTSQADEVGRICEIKIGGEATTSTKNRWAWRRSTTNGGTPTSQTPAKKSPTSPAAYIAVATTFSSQPVTAGAPAPWAEAMDQHGNTIHWISPEDDDDLWILGATVGNSEGSLESSSGTGAATVDIVHEEV